MWGVAALSALTLLKSKVNYLFLIAFICMTGASTYPAFHNMHAEPSISYRLLHGVALVLIFYTCNQRIQQSFDGLSGKITRIVQVIISSAFIYGCYWFMLSMVWLILAEY